MSARPVPILLYHGVDHDPVPALAPFVMDPERFAQHMDVLVERGASTFTVSAWCDLLDSGEEPPPDAVLVTFDDGLADFGRHAWPILRERCLAATLYVVSGNVGGEADWLASLGDTPPMLTWADVIRLDQEGCEIGSHSVSHPELDVLDSEALVQEVRQSRVDLAVHLGHSVRSFAYPHGYHGKRVKDAVRMAGFDSACAVRNLWSTTDDDHHALARITIDGSCTADGLRALLDGHGRRVARPREQLRTKGWRAYRRARRNRSARSVPAARADQQVAS
jgi:peptidoglycan/xylan/chitin deacetylase (PgdA/CDA1 family)